MMTWVRSTKAAMLESLTLIITTQEDCNLTNAKGAREVVYYCDKKPIWKMVQSDQENLVYKYEVLEQ